MKNVQTPKKSPYTILSRGIYTKKEESGSIIPLKQKKWVYVAGKVLTLTVALFFIAGSFIWGTDGSWDIATIFFIVGMFFFIPFILFGRKIKELNIVREVK